MKDSVKAKLIVFFIIALLAFGVSSAFASLTISEDNDSYKIIPIKNDSFEPNYINKVPTIVPKVEKNYTITNNTTTNATTDYDIEEIEDNTGDDWNVSFDEFEDE
jgi:hypothetical protein